MRAGRVAAVVAAIGVAAAAVVAYPAGAGAPDERRGLTVNAVGSVMAAPDVAEWSFGVQTDAATAREALRGNGVAMRRLIAALKAAGVAPNDLRTQQVSLYPRSSGDGSEVVGYTASNTVQTIIRAIARAGSIVDAAADAGANQIFGPALTVSASDDLYAQALERAYDQAVAKASRLAAKSGVTLGSVLAIVEGGEGFPGPVAEAADAGGTPIEPGQSTIRASLTVTFAIA